MMLASLLLLLDLFIISDGNDCIFEDSSGSTEFNLHLEWFPNNNILLERKDDEQDFMYYYSVCENKVGCGTGANATGQIEQSWTNSYCYIVSHFTTDVKPIYNASMGANGTWIFNYTNGWDFECDPGFNRQISIYWNCNMSTKGKITKVIEPDAVNRKCVYEMYIDSQWACLGQIPPSKDDQYNFWEDETIIIISISCLVGIILIIFIIFIWFKRCQKRREVKDLMNDILKDDDEIENYGTGTDIDLHDNISDISKTIPTHRNNEFSNSKSRQLLTSQNPPLYE